MRITASSCPADVVLRKCTDTRDFPQRHPKDTPKTPQRHPKDSWCSPAGPPTKKDACNRIAGTCAESPAPTAHATRMSLMNHKHANMAHNGYVPKPFRAAPTHRPAAWQDRCATDACSMYWSLVLRKNPATQVAEVPAHCGRTRFARCSSSRIARCIAIWWHALCAM